MKYDNLKICATNKDNTINFYTYEMEQNENRFANNISGDQGV